MEEDCPISRETGKVFLDSWRDRKFNQDLQTQIMNTVKFLNDFDVSARARLSALDRKLLFLHKRITYLSNVVGVESK